MSNFNGKTARDSLYHRYIEPSFRLGGVPSISLVHLLKALELDHFPTLIGHLSNNVQM